MKRQLIFRTVSNSQGSFLWKILTVIITSNLVNAQIENSGVTVYGAPTVDMANGVNMPTGFSKSLYSVKVKKADTATATLLTPYVYCAKVNDTYTTGGHDKNERYYEPLWKCSHSYVNFQTNGAVFVEVRKVDGTAFSSLTNVYPIRFLKKLSNGSYYDLSDSKVLRFTMTEASNVAVDVDGKQMSRPHDDDVHYRNTPTSLPATHALSIHATEPITPPSSGTIKYASPSAKPSETFSEGTLVFQKGIHKIGSNFKVHPNKKYYIPGDAIVYGTFNNKNDSLKDGSLAEAIGIHFYGHGTITGNELQHWELDKVNVPGPTGPYNYSQGNTTVYDVDKNTSSPLYQEQQRISYKKIAIELNECLETRIEGIVILNPANHSLKLFTAKREETRANIVKHLKIFAWRTNSDGGGINDSSKVEKCFYRVQDDGFYPKGITLKNNVLWSDANGACLRLDALKDIRSTDFTVENIDIIFRRNSWWSSSSAIEMPITSSIHTKNCTFIDINVSDYNAIRPMIDLRVQSGGELANVTFKNVTISSKKAKNILSATGTGKIHDITFDNVRIDGVLITESNFATYFDKSGDVYGLKFNPNGTGGTPTTGGELAGALQRGNWTFNASSNSVLAPNVRDGKREISSRWESGYQNQDQWFLVNMGAPNSINQIVLDNTGSPGDFPRAYKVEVSDNGSSWVQVAAATANTIDGENRISFTSRTTQYIRVTQTGRALDRYWSITEFNVFATPSTPSPTLSHEQIGTFSASATQTGGVWNVTSAGQDIYNSPDNFSFVRQSATGNYRITAKVENLGSAISWARAGVMIRDDNGTGSNYAMVCVTPGYGVKFQNRSTPGGGSGIQDMANNNNSVWVKLEKSGDTYTGWYSTDGTNWVGQKSALILNMNTHLIGIMSSGNGGQPCTAVISNVKIEVIN